MDGKKKRDEYAVLAIPPALTHPVHWQEIQGLKDSQELPTQHGFSGTIKPGGIYWLQKQIVSVVQS